MPGCTLFADASFCNDSGAGGWAAWMVSERRSTFAGAIIPSRMPHSGIAELYAIERGVEAALAALDPTQMAAVRDEALEEAARWHDAQIEWGDCGEDTTAIITRQRINLHHRKSAAAIRALKSRPAPIGDAGQTGTGQDGERRS